MLPCTSSNSSQDAEGILRIADRPLISALFNPQFGAGPFERLIAIVVLAVAPFPVPPGVEVHGAEPAILVADRWRNRQLEAFRGKPERLAVKVGVPAVHRNICRGEQLHKARPDPCERWRISELGIGQTGDFRGLTGHDDIGLAERLIEDLAVLVHDSDFNDLKASVLQLPVVSVSSSKKGVRCSKSASNCASI